MHGNCSFVFQGCTKKVDQQLSIFQSPSNMRDKNFVARMIDCARIRSRNRFAISADVVRLALGETNPSPRAYAITTSSHSVVARIAEHFEKSGKLTAKRKIKFI